MYQDPVDQQFVAETSPFDLLDASEREALVDVMETRQLAAGETLEDSDTTHVWLIHYGAIELLRPDGTLQTKLGEGELCGQHNLSDTRESPALQARAAENSLLYALPVDSLRPLCDKHRPFATALGVTRDKTLRGAAQRLTSGDDSGTNLLTIPLSELIGRTPITLPPDASIQQAAGIMTEQAISSMLVVEDEQLVGIITDRDLCTRVVAKGVSSEQPLRTIMTENLSTLPSTAYGFEALLAMARSNVHHLPVVDDGRIRGMVTATDLLQRRASSAIYLVGDINKRRSREELAEASHLLPRILVGLVDANATAHSAGHVISAVGEAITNRLLTLAEERLGPPPVPYVWLTAGSLARFEQTALSDQDNGLLLGDDYDPDEHGEYFEQLARYVCDGLNTCGYVYCPGDVMAMNPEWRQPLRQWMRYFDGWIESPEPKALMLSSIFFDLRPLAGDFDLFRQLSEHVLEKSRKNRIFLSYMTSNSLTHQPPLGFFRNFVLIRGGEHANTLDLKHNGVVPIVDLARIYSLSIGIKPVNTRERLEAVVEAGELSSSGGADLLDAMEFIGTVRLQHQARQIRRGDNPDNFVSPKVLSQFERNHLKDAFSVVRTLQAALGQRFQSSRLG